ncbi:MAG: hypothetical protein AABZ12_05905 [Planctomycetota bacterium]
MFRKAAFFFLGVVVGGGGGFLVAYAASTFFFRGLAWFDPSLGIALGLGYGIVLPITAVLLTPAGAALGATAALRWIDRPTALGRCPCGYDLTGNVSGMCPECGRRFTHVPTRS